MGQEERQLERRNEVQSRDLRRTVEPRGTIAMRRKARTKETLSTREPTHERKIQMKRVHDTGASGSSMTTTALTKAGIGMRDIGTSVVKGTLVNMPLAFAEGFRNTPALYGEKVRDLGPVTDWKSGGVVAAKVRIKVGPCTRGGTSSSPFLLIAQKTHDLTELRLRLLRGHHRPSDATHERAQKRRNHRTH